MTMTMKNIPHQCRHLSFRDDDMALDLHTFPGGLLARSGHGTFVFANGAADDILANFRASGVNPRYWAEKLTAGTARSWSEERFVAWLIETAQDRGVLAQVQEQILHPDSDHNLEYEDSARWALACTYEELGIAFPASDEVGLDDWDSHYLRTLDMIVRCAHAHACG